MSVCRFQCSHSAPMLEMCWPRQNCVKIGLNSCSLILAQQVLFIWLCPITCFWNCSRVHPCRCRKCVFVCDSPLFCSHNTKVPCAHGTIRASRFLDLYDSWCTPEISLNPKSGGHVNHHDETAAVRCVIECKHAILFGICFFEKMCILCWRQKTVPDLRIMCWINRPALCSSQFGHIKP